MSDKETDGKSASTAHRHSLKQMKTTKWYKLQPTAKTFLHLRRVFAFNRINKRCQVYKLKYDVCDENPT